MDDLSQPTPPPARRRHWVRRVLFGLLGLALLVALAPFYTGPLLRGLVVDRIEEQLDARATVQAVSFGWPARLHLRGLELTDPAGQPLAALDDLHASLALGALLSGRIVAEVDVAYPELHLARAADGRWNWEHALARGRAAEESDDEAGSEPQGLPDVAGSLRLQDGHVVVHGTEGETTLADIALELRLDGLERPAPFLVQMNVRGPGGPAGSLGLEGSFTAASGGRIDALACRGEAKLALERLDLAAFGPAFGLLAPGAGLAGVLDGGAELQLGAGLALEGASELVLTDLAVRGPLAAEPARIARVELTGRATQAGEGAGSQRLELRAESFLALTYEGRSLVPAAGAGELSGTLTFGAELARLVELARGWVPLQPGVAVQGRLEHTLDLTAALRDRAPVSATLRARGGVEGLAGRDAAGRALDLAELQGIALELEAAADLALGTLSVPKLALRAGPLACTGNLEASGLAPGGTLALKSGALRLEADLEKLRGTLAQVVELDQLSFGGRVDAQANLVQRNQALELELVLDGRTLVFDGTSLADLHGELRARRADEGPLSGSGTLRLGALHVPVAGAAPLEFAGTTLELGFQENASGQGEHSLGLRSDDGALALTAQARSVRDPGGELTLTTSYRLDGRVARLAELAAAFTRVQPGLSGDLRAQGDLHAKLAGGELLEAGGRSDLFLTSLAAQDASGKALPFEALARTTVGLEGEYDARTGRAELRSLALETGGLTLRGSGRAVGLGSESAPDANKDAGPDAAPAGARIEEARLELEADLESLGRELARLVDLGGYGLSGSPLACEVRLSTQAERLEASGTLTAARVGLQRPVTTPLELAELGLDFDLGYDTALGSLHVRRAALRSQTATLALTGTLNELATPEKARGAMQLELAGRLERILGDLGLEPPEAGRRSTGALTAKLALEGDRGAFRVTGRGALDGFRLELAPALAGEAPTVIEEPSIVLTCEGKLTLAALDVEFDKLTLESGLARGGAQGRIENLRRLDGGEVRFVGLTGQLAYVPDRLGVVLAPFLPGKLSGAKEERVTFTLDGHARDFELMTLLMGSQARVDLGFGLFERPEIQLGGALVLEAKDETLLLRGDLGANGGALQLDGVLDLGHEDPRSKLTIKAKGLRATPGLAPLLALVHPAFGSAQLAQGSLEGLIGLDLDLAYDGPLTLEALEQGWQALPKEPIQGSGRLELNGAKLSGSPLLALLTEFGVDANRALDLRPIEFTVQKGRVTYAKPWTWTLSGTETSFTGSLGLDQSLDLAWNVPITDKLIERWSFLAALKGQSLAVPLRGSVSKPRLETEGLLKDLAAKAARAELESRLGLGGKTGSEDPDTILAQADQLWSQGKRAEAAALYLRMREDFKLSLAYALNKDRIKERSKFTEPPK